MLERHNDLERLKQEARQFVIDKCVRENERMYLGSPKALDGMHHSFLYSVYFAHPIVILFSLSWFAALGVGMTMHMFVREPFPELAILALMAVSTMSLCSLFLKLIKIEAAKGWIGRKDLLDERARLFSLMWFEKHAAHRANTKHRKAVIAERVSEALAKLDEKQMLVDYLVYKLNEEERCFEDNPVRKRYKGDMIQKLADCRTINVKIEREMKLLDQDSESHVVKMSSDATIAISSYETRLMRLAEHEAHVKAFFDNARDDVIGLSHELRRLELRKELDEHLFNAAWMARSVEEHISATLFDLRKSVDALVEQSYRVVPIEALHEIIDAPSFNPHADMASIEKAIKSLPSGRMPEWLKE